MRMEPLMEALKTADGEEIRLEPGEKIYMLRAGGEKFHRPRAGLAWRAASDGEPSAQGVPDLVARYNTAHHEA